VLAILHRGTDSIGDGSQPFNRGLKEPINQGVGNVNWPSSIFHSRDALCECRASAAERSDRYYVSVRGTELPADFIHATPEKRNATFHLSGDTRKWIARVHPDTEGRIRTHAQHVQIMKALARESLVPTVADVYWHDLSFGFRINIDRLEPGS
jgi:hypothetical protein